jgi:CNT family concentrative nucleoside transporter
MAAIQGVSGAVAMLALAWLASERRDAIAWRPVLGGVALAVVLAALVRWLPGAGTLLASANEALDALQTATSAGTAFVFGYLGGGPLPWSPSAPGLITPRTL